VNFFDRLDELMMQLARNALEAQAKQLRAARAAAEGRDAKNSPEPPPASTPPPRRRRRRVAKGKGDVLEGRVLEAREEVSPASPGEATASAAKKDERR
jgi:hypothetical protein